MKLKVLVLMTTLSSIFLFADPYATFSSVTDFDASIKSLVTAPQTMNPDRLYLLEGTISSLNVIDADPDHFYAEAQFFGSEWIERRDLKTYSIWLVFGKPAFAQMMPKRGGGNSDGMVIAPSTKGMALVQYLDTIQLPDGQTAYVFNVHEYRTIER